MSKILLLVSFITLSAQASHDRWELGLGAGTTHPFAGETYKSASDTGDGQNYWLGYGLTENWSAELAYDNLDFDKSNAKNKFYTLGGVYRYHPENMLHPLAKIGLGSAQFKDVAGEKETSVGAKAALGIEADCKYVSFGGLLNYFYANKSEKSLALKNVQSIQPALFLTLHNALDSHAAAASPSTKSEMAYAPKANDTDGDGIIDSDDKCPNSPKGAGVNAIGCTETEKASVKINVEFPTGKSSIDKKSSAEIQSLADFMKKFPTTSVEVAGHTDNVGSEKANTALSQKRADAVRAALVAKGIAASRLTAKGYGPTQPIGDNSTKEGREQNRRVTAEITVGK